jgi:hypothetical protein
MDVILQNWLPLVLVLFCVGMHFLGRGHGCGGHSHSSKREQPKSIETQRKVGRA